MPNSYESLREGSRRAQAADGRPPGYFVRLRGPRRGWLRPFKWLDPRSLLQSRNDFVARMHDPVHDLRREWMKLLDPEGAGNPDLVIDRRRPGGRSSLLVLGDPGEGDSSQWVLVPAIRSLSAETDLMIVCSDVIYPTGDVNDYPQKFFEPYSGYDKPIYALPGNHDWYDQLQGFMFAFCHRQPPEGMEPRLPWLLGRLWRRPKPVSARTRERRDAFAGRPDPPQPGPYWVMDLGPLALVAIDTGICGELDREQGDWLQRVSRRIDKPKVLLTGKPIYVDNAYHPGPVEQRDFTVDQVVREPTHRYVAAIGGDIHNYQRYPVRLSDTQQIEYLVAGGGGAFMHATHRIAPIDLGHVSENGSNPDPEHGDGFRCFPLRGASLEFYQRVLIPKLRHLIGLVTLIGLVFGAAAGVLLGLCAPRWWALEGGILLALPALGSLLALRYVARLGAFQVCFRRRQAWLTPSEAAQYMADRMADGQPTLEPRQTLSPQKERLAELIWPRFGRTRGALHQFFSEIFDIDDPPLYKQFLRLDVTPEELTISCLVAVGTEGKDDPPALEDRIRIPLPPAP
jgi:hypothetical protein